MMQATVAVYPLQQEDYTAVHQAIDALRAAGVNLETRSMHTEISGNEAAVFQALQAAYQAAAATGAVVMTVTLSNACPARNASPPTED